MSGVGDDAVDEPEESGEEPAEEPAEEPEETDRRPVRRWVTPVLVLAVAAALAGAGWTGWQVREEQRSDDADAAALAAGREAAVAFTSYDYRELDDDLSRVAGASTGEFRDQFTRALGALTEAIEQAKGVSVGRITQAGLVDRTGDVATVLAAVDASITNTASAEPRTRRYRLQITLDRSSGAWLISDIAPVA